MTKPLVSIIVPVFNAGRFLNKTLESLCGQDYWELEILCIDDGSKDDSADIIKSFEKKDQRVKYIPQANAGPGAARNHGIELSNGEYIVFQDADDLLHKQALSILVKMAEEYHADVTICGFQSCGEDLSNAKWDVPLDAKPEIFTGDLPLAFQDSRKFRGHPWGKLYRRDVIGDIRFNDLRSGEDTYFNIDIAAHAKCMVVLPQTLYIYRQASASLTHQASHHEKTIEAGKAIGLHCIDLFQRGEISCQAMVALIRRYATNAICLHLLLMMDNTAISNTERKTLLAQACDSIVELRQATPFEANLFSRKYHWVYLTAMKTRSLGMLELACKIRKCLLNFCGKFR